MGARGRDGGGEGQREIVSDLLIPVLRAVERRRNARVVGCLKLPVGADESTCDGVEDIARDCRATIFISPRMSSSVMSSTERQIPGQIFQRGLRR